MTIKEFKEMLDKAIEDHNESHRTSKDIDEDHKISFCDLHGNPIHVVESVTIGGNFFDPEIEIRFGE